jgi:type II secretory pathway pseudopilin PulG
MLAVTRKNAPNNLREGSFTLIETMIALGILATVILQISGVQANAVFFGDFARRSTQAIWLAKRVLSQVEYQWMNREFAELKAEEDNAKFEGLEEVDELKDFTYKLTISEWKLPLTDLILGGGQGEGEEAGGKNPAAGLIESQLGDDLLRVATVEVSWPEGARRNSESLTLLLTNQRKLDTMAEQYKAAAEKLGGRSGSAPSPSPSGAGSNPAPAPTPGPSPT